MHIAAHGGAVQRSNGWVQRRRRLAEQGNAFMPLGVWTSGQSR
jgi:hypothetical protein